MIASVVASTTAVAVLAAGVGARAPSAAAASANRMMLICFWTGNQSETMLRDTS